MAPTVPPTVATQPAVGIPAFSSQTCTPFQSAMGLWAAIGLHHLPALSKSTSSLFEREREGERERERDIYIYICVHNILMYTVIMNHIYIYTHLYTWQWELHLQHEVSTHAGILILPTCPSLQVGPHPLNAKELRQECHAATHILILVTRLWEWGDGLSLWRGRIVQALHSCTPWTAIIYIYTHTFLPNAYAFLFLFTSSFMTWTFTFLVACWLWSQRLAAPFSSSSDRAGTTRRTARPPSASASPGCDNGGFRGFEDRFGNHIDIPSYKIHHPSFWYTMVYLANGWFRGFIDGDTWWYMNLTVNI